MRHELLAAVLATGGLLALSGPADAQYRPIYVPGAYRGPVYSYGGNSYFQSYGYSSGYARPAAVYPNANPLGYNPYSGTGFNYQSNPAVSGYHPYGYNAGYGYGYGYGRRR